MSAQIADSQAEKVSEIPAEISFEAAAEAAIDTSDEKPAEDLAGKPDVPSLEKATEAPRETLVESSTEKPVEDPVVEPQAEEQVKAPVEEPVAISTKELVETPATVGAPSGEEIPISDTTDKNLTKILNLLDSIIEEANGYDEIYGYQINTKGEYLNTKVRDAILLKFLKANNNDIEATKKQIVSTLKWRKEFDPLKAAYVETHDPKFNDIGALTKDSENKPNERVITWNLYGNITSPKDIFSDLDKFLRWRVGLMEKSISLLDFENKDNSFVAQLHDYEKVSMWRMDSDVKAGTKATIHIFGSYYPELLSVKFFVNVPIIMSWVFGFVSKFISQETVKKFVVLSNGKEVVSWLGDNIPPQYGGKGKGLFEQEVDEIKIPTYAGVLLQNSLAANVD